MNKTELLETRLCHHQAAKNTRADHFISNPSQEYLKTVQKSSVAPLYRASKEHYKNATRQQKTPAQTTICLESLPGMSKYIAKIFCCPPVQGI